MTLSLGLTVDLRLPMPQAEQQVREALAIEGFGVITVIDLQAAFKEKLGHASPPFTILGACNPALAFRALSADPQVGLLLPCNVTLEGRPDGHTRVRLVDPLTLLGSDALAGQPVIAEVAEQANARLQGVARRLAS